jgi:hypothetical protein
LPNFADTSFGPVAILKAAIDTTFALHRAGEPFRRLKASLRVYEPYEARHLDWYISDAGEDHYARTSSPAIAHWNNQSERDAHAGEALAFNHFTAVRMTATHGLEIYQEHLPFGPASRADVAVRRGLRSLRRQGKLHLISSVLRRARKMRQG